jgi:hypothetical protein
MDSGLLDDNSPTSNVLVLLMAIVLSVFVVFRGSSTPPFISKGVRLQRR